MAIASPAVGRWPFASGCQHGDYLGLQAVVIADGAPVTKPGGGAELRVAVLPAAQVRLVENWQVVGLRGTGSHDLVLDDVFVPAGWTATVFGAQPTLSDTLFKISVPAQPGLYVAAVAIGIAEGVRGGCRGLAAGGNARRSVGRGWRNLRCAMTVSARRMHSSVPLARLR